MQLQTFEQTEVDTQDRRRGFVALSVFFFAVAPCFAGGMLPAVGNADTVKAPAPDRIYLVGDTTLRVLVVKETSDSIRYILEGEAVEKAVDRKQVRSVVKGARPKPTTQPPKVQKTGEEPWRSVVVTRKEGDVKGMRALGDKSVEVTLTLGQRGKRAKASDIEKAAIIQLRQRAVEQKATHILIESLEVMQAYGEPPSVKVKYRPYRKTVLSK